VREGAVLSEYTREEILKLIEENDGPEGLDLSGEVASKLVKASEVYANNTVLRALVNAIPYVGGSLDVLFAYRGQQIVQERIMGLLEDLSIEMGGVREEVVDRKYLESEEWFDLILRGIGAATKTRDQEKIRLYAKILKGAVTAQNREEFAPEEYLVVLAELTPKEIEVARAIYEQQSGRPQDSESELQWAKRKGWEKLSGQCLSVPKEDLPFVLLHLQRSGLIREITGAYLGYTGGVYVITETFRKLMRYLSEGHGQDADSG
jgi:hypothetical protein